MLTQTIDVFKDSAEEPLSMIYISEWLEDNKFLFEKINRIQKSIASTSIGNEVLILPNKFENTSEDLEFLDLYRQLLSLKEYHSKENTYKLKLEELSNLNDKEPELLKAYYTENLALFDDDIFSFFIQYYDEESDYLKVPLISNNPSIRVNLECFKNTITFSDVFENTFLTK